ncbi:hypothetical protein GGI22_005412 [Coemansia erecta]|nr:hypothetical protein GGI22_005412 [Coemansia erecta]
MDKDYARLCDVATFFSNTNTLPVSLIKSIALSSGTQFLLKDADDTPLKVAARGVSYAMIFATLNNILRWSFGVALMGGVKQTKRTDFNSVSTTPRTGAHSRTASSARGLPPSPPLAPSGSPALDMLRTFARDSIDDDELTPLYLGVPAHAVRPSKTHRAMQLARSAGKGIRRAWDSAQTCITPPVYAIIAAFVVILIDPLHEEMMKEASVLHTLWSAIDMCGDACVPLVLISLGGQLGMMSAQKSNEQPKSATQPMGAESPTNSTRFPSSVHIGSVHVAVSDESSDRGVPPIMLRTDTEAGGSTIDLGERAEMMERGGEVQDDEGDARISVREQRKGAAVVLVGRFVFVPTLAMILITTLRVVFPRLLPIMTNDPVYILTLLILSSTPPAINLITVAQATGKFESEAAQILFYGYVLGIFVLAVEVAGFLWLTNMLTHM